MVMRYFGSKRELFALTADFDLQLPDLSDVPRDRVGRAGRAPAVAVGGRRAAQDPVRTAMTDDDAADRMRSIFAAQLTPLVGKSVL